MVEKKEIDAHLNSVAASVEGGVQDSCDDACSICLEAFSDIDPSSVTNCKHAFHLQCILEWKLDTGDSGEFTPIKRKLDSELIESPDEGQADIMELVASQGEGVSGSRSYKLVAVKMENN